MLLRFVLLRSHPDTGMEEGIFSAAYELCKAAPTSENDRRSLQDLLAWFEANLTVPQRFNRTNSKGYYRRKTKGISWLKPSAKEHINKIRELAGILEENGYSVTQIETDKAGYVIFEDDYQIIAEPFRDTQR